MGREKERLIKREDDWMALANKQDHRCKWCGTVIPYGDRDLYFRTGECGSCHASLSKDD